MTRTDRKLEQLTAMAFEVESLEAATPFMHSGCLRMNRLQRLTAGEPASRDERQHIAGCARCRTRVRLLGAAIPSTRVRRRLAWRVARGALTAVAAGIAWLWVLPQQDEYVSPTGLGLASPDIEMRLASVDPGALRAHFRPIVADNAALLALFRTWNGECACWTWRVYEWKDGRTVNRVRPGEAVDITLDVSDAPPVDQLLFLAVANIPGQLPTDAGEAEGLIACLNSHPPTDPPSADVSTYASAVESCLPAGVTLVAKQFCID